MAIDPYYKSRRIRNVIQAARAICVIFKMAAALEKKSLKPNTIRFARRMIAEELWAQRDCNKW